MTALTFTLRSKPEFNLDVSPLTPDHLSSLSLDKIKSLKLKHGKQKLSVSKLFKLTGKNRNHIKINNTTSHVVSVGKQMSQGLLEIDGDVGKYLGQGMSNGQIIVRGNAGDWIGNIMTGGRIDIHGDAGDFVGASLPGDTFGMNRGFINIYGNAGDRIGDRMRRGTIVVRGNANDFCGSRMHAGTIVVMGKAGKNTGIAMRRGSLVLAKKPVHLSPTFKSCGNLKMQFLRLLFTQLANMGDEFSMFRNVGPVAHRFSGDRARNGKGEILLLQKLNTRKRIK